MTEHVQTVVIGAGVVGLAIARALALSGREVLILEREPAFGTITSARNSEVIHAGIYYAKDSLKARLCVKGRRALYAYCAAHGIAHRRCGKLIVACSAEEVGQLAGIAARARANGVDDLREISAAEARAIEPALACHGALLSPSTGIVDSHALMLTLLGEAENAGAILVPNTEIAGLAARGEGEGFAIRTGGAAPMELAAGELVNAAGLGAPALATIMRDLPRNAVPRQWLARGNYFSLAGRAPFSHLVYPAPVAGGLGVHLSLDLAGRVRFGPDVEWIEDEDYSVDPGRATGFYQAIRRYWPDLPDGALAPDYAGIRPKLAPGGNDYGGIRPESSPGGNADFRIDGRDVHGLSGHVGLYGIESPGLTSSLAIGEMVRTMLDADRR